MGIQEEWNKIAEAKLLDRLAGNDISYNSVLLPVIYERTQKLKHSIENILDFGCGTGELTYEISKLDVNIIGLDISEHSIQLAKEYFNRNNLNFINAYLSNLKLNFKFDLIIASMSLMDTSDIKFTFSTMCSNLKENGKMLVTITHPAFWPIYWNYCGDSQFDYSKEVRITKTYRTSTKVFSGYLTTHYHRPISFYIDLFRENNMNITEIKELKSPKDTVWYPRFLFFEITKQSN